MKIAVLSGKGGAGKTTIATNIAYTIGKTLQSDKSIVYVDCDVEEPNGRIFLKPQNTRNIVVKTMLPEFSLEKCIGCRKCVDFCEFNALLFVKNHPKVFPEVCHSCGGCKLVCPANAVTEIGNQVGIIQQGENENINIISGEMDLGKASGVPIISEEATLAENFDTVVFDCPPGSACPVVETVSHADYCIIVVEPTAFGFHNFKMVYELSKVLHKPCGIVVNKEDIPYQPLEIFCKENNITILAKLPFDKKAAKIIAHGSLLAKDESYFKEFSKILQNLNIDIKNKIGA